MQCFECSSRTLIAAPNQRPNSPMDMLVHQSQRQHRQCFSESGVGAKAGCDVVGNLDEELEIEHFGEEVIENVAEW
jgi:hypothetical protein